MKKFKCAVFFITVFCFKMSSQTMPGEGSLLNYRLVGFSWPEKQNAINYSLEIATGNFYDEDSFKRNIVSTTDTRAHKLIAEVPSFGTFYTWRVAYSIGHTKTVFSSLFHFATGTIHDVDTALTRLRILTKAKKYDDAFVFVDGHRALYDMNGNPIWYLPETPELNYENNSPRDLQMTPFHTITFILGEKVYETDYNGKILWKVPETDKPEHFHHEFTRLSNGHYMVLGAEVVKEYLSDSYSQTQSGLLVIPEDKVIQDTNENNPGYYFYKKEQFPKVIEYDSLGNVVWQYRSSGYFDHSDLYFRKNPDGSVNTTGHDNAFFFDEKAGELYICVRDISRIIKIKYPEGTTLGTYGEMFAPRAPQYRGKGLYCNPHNTRISDSGYLYMYNNNACNWPAQPTVVILQQPASDKDSLRKIWEYPCTFDDMAQDEVNKLKMFSGGSVCELPDHSLLVDMGGQYSKLFIVTRDKEIIWSAMPEKFSRELNKWQQSSQYRVSIIANREDLEQLIWKTSRPLLR